MKRTIPVTSLLLLLLLACGTARRGEPFGPVNLSSAQARQGEETFMRHCHECHPGGEGGIGPAINNKPLPGFMIRMQARLGVGYMPAFPEEKLSPADLDALIVYLKELRQEERPQ